MKIEQSIFEFKRNQMQKLYLKHLNHFIAHTPNLPIKSMQTYECMQQILLGQHKVSLLVLEKCEKALKIVRNYVESKVREEVMSQRAKINVDALPQSSILDESEPSLHCYDDEDEDEIDVVGEDNEVRGEDKQHVNEAEEDKGTNSHQINDVIDLTKEFKMPIDGDKFQAKKASTPFPRGSLSTSDAQSDTYFSTQEQEQDEKAILLQFINMLLEKVQNDGLTNEQRRAIMNLMATETFRSLVNSATSGNSLNESTIDTNTSASMSSEDFFSKSEEFVNENFTEFMPGYETVVRETKCYYKGVISRRRLNFDDFEAPVESCDSMENNPGSSKRKSDNKNLAKKQINKRKLTIGEDEAAKITKKRCLVKRSK